LIPVETADREVGRHPDFDLFVTERERGHAVLVKSVPPARHDLHARRRSDPIATKGRLRIGMEA
jgi:hypothetical protein